MDGNNWRAAHAHAQIPGQVMGSEPVANGAMEDGDWRGQLQPESRQRIVNKIMETLKRHLPYSGQDGLQELKKIAVRFEEKIYLAATNQSDYLRKISMKMLTMETKSQNSNSMQSGSGNNSQDPASQSMQTQIQNQVQQLQLPMVSNQSQVWQQILSQNLHNNIATNGVPNSAGLSSALPAMSGTMPNVPGPNASIQNMQSLPNMASNGIGNPMGQGMPAGTYANQQRQIQNRQQPVSNQEQPQQSQGSHQYVYNQQVFMKQKFQQSGIPQQSLMQPQAPQQQQQQNLMQPNQLQTSQQAVMQPSLRQTSSPSSSSSSTLQNPQSSLQHSNQSLLQQPSQSVLRQQQPQAPVMHQQQNSMTQHSILSSQQQLHISQQLNAPNIQSNQLIGQQNMAADTPQQQRMMVQQNSMANMQQQHVVSKQSNLPSLHQQQSVAQQNNISNVHQQQFGSQNNISGFQQQQVMQGSMPNMLPNQTQPQPVQQQLMSQMHAQPGQMQQQLGLQQQANSLSRDMQQRIQTSGPLNQQQSGIDQKQLIQPQRVIGESQINASSQIGNSSGGDWQEEVYQKIKSMHDMYYPEVNDAYLRMVTKLQQHDSIPQVPKSDQLEKLHFFKAMLERLLAFLRTSKNEIQPFHRDKAVQVEKQIISILNSSRPRKPVLQKDQPGQLHMLTVQQPQQQQPQISQVSEGQMNHQMQSPNAQGSVINSLTSLPHGSMSSASGVPNSRQSMMDVMQSGSNCYKPRSKQNLGNE